MGGSEASGNGNLRMGGFCGAKGNGNRAIPEKDVPGNSKYGSTGGDNSGNHNTKPASTETGGPGVTSGVWHSRGYLPHFESAEVVQHVTYHLADSLPTSVLERFEAELKSTPLEKRDSERRKRLEAWLDAGHGSCVLRHSRIAAGVQDAILYFDAQRYRLFAWVVMPNHVHVLLQVINGWTLARVLDSWKKFAGRMIAEYRGFTPGVSEGVWQREYWDRYIRHEGHFRHVVEYIHNNPVKAGLVRRAEEWRWSSAYLPGSAGLCTDECDANSENSATTGVGDPPNCKSASTETGAPGKPASTETGAPGKCTGAESGAPGKT